MEVVKMYVVVRVSDVLHLGRVVGRTHIEHFIKVL